MHRPANGRSRRVKRSLAMAKKTAVNKKKKGGGFGSVNTGKKGGGFGKTLK